MLSHQDGLKGQKPYKTNLVNKEIVQQIHLNKPTEKTREEK